MLSKVFYFAGFKLACTVLLPFSAASTDTLRLIMVRALTLLELAAIVVKFTLGLFYYRSMIGLPVLAWSPESQSLADYRLSKVTATLILVRMALASLTARGSCSRTPPFFLLVEILLLKLLAWPFFFL